MTTELCLRGSYLNISISIFVIAKDHLTAAKLWRDSDTRTGREERRSDGGTERRVMKPSLLPASAGGHESLMVWMTMLGIGFSP